MDDIKYDKNTDYGTPTSASAKQITLTIDDRQVTVPEWCFNYACRRSCGCYGAKIMRYR